VNPAPRSNTVWTCLTVCVCVCVCVWVDGWVNFISTGDIYEDFTYKLATYLSTGNVAN